MRILGILAKPGLEFNSIKEVYIEQGREGKLGERNALGGEDAGSGGSDNVSGSTGTQDDEVVVFATRHKVNCTRKKSLWKVLGMV